MCEKWVHTSLGTAAAISTPTDSDAKRLKWLGGEIGERLIAGIVLHTGASIYQLNNRIYAIPLSSFWA